MLWSGLVSPITGYPLLSWDMVWGKAHSAARTIYEKEKSRIVFNCLYYISKSPRRKQRKSNDGTSSGPNWQRHKRYICLIKKVTGNQRAQQEEMTEREAELHHVISLFHKLNYIISCYFTFLLGIFYSTLICLLFTQ